MPTRTYTWNEEYYKKFYESEKVQDHLKKFIEQAKQPKSIEQKQKMSIAKVGKKFSQTHKDNMAEAHKFRQALKKEIIAKQPDLPIDQVWDLVRQEMKD